MPKIDVLIRVTNEDSNQEYKTTAIITDDIIKYKSNDDTIEIFDYNNFKLTRENKELRMEYEFNKNETTKGMVFAKELNHIVDVNIKTKKIERNNYDIDVEFEVENNTIKYHIEEVKWVYIKS